MFFHAKRNSLSNDESILTSSSTSLQGESYMALALGGQNSITLSKKSLGKDKAGKPVLCFIPGLNKTRFPVSLL